MSSSGEHFGIDLHAIMVREAPGRRRARQERVSRWPKVALAAAFAISVARADAAEVDPPVAKPTPFQTPFRWEYLPPPTALVHLKTPIGSFKLPIGYLQNWFALEVQPTVTARDGDREFSGPLTFRFEYPSGGMNANPAWKMTVHDSEGRVVQGRTVVFVDYAAPPDSWTEDLEAETLGTHPPGSLVHDDGHSRPDHEALNGVAAGSGPGHRIGVHLSCDINCLFWFYLERQRVVLKGVMDGHFRHDGLAIAEQAQALFEQWQTTPTGKGD